MASGKNHDKGIFLQTPIVFAIAASTTQNIGLTVAATTAHLIGGLFLSPDLDCPSRPYYRWGVLRFIWLPYMKLVIPHHRHVLSHGLILGSLVRIIYIVGLVLGVMGLVDAASVHVNLNLYEKAIALIQQNVFQRLCVVIFVSVEMSAINHYMLDNLYGLLPKSVYKSLQ